MARPKKAPVKKADVAAQPETDEVRALGEPTIEVKSLLAEFQKIADVNRKLAQEIEELKEIAGTQDPREGGHRIVSGQAPDIAIDKPLPTEVPENCAVFRSPYPGFRQVIRKGSITHHPNGETTIDAPLIAEFMRGVCVLHDTDEIEMMRTKLKAKSDKGEADFIEVSDPEVKAAAIHGTKAITSPEVSVDTPASSLV